MNGGYESAGAVALKRVHAQIKRWDAAPRWKRMWWTLRGFDSGRAQLAFMRQLGLGFPPPRGCSPRGVDPA